MKANDNRAVNVQGGLVKNVIKKNSEGYVGILFNGDCNIYRKATLKALKARKADKEIISEVKDSNGDLEISKILIDADMYDILVSVFSTVDAKTAVNDYLDCGYQAIVAKFNEYKKNFKPEFDKSEDVNEVIQRIDAEINDKCSEVAAELEKFHSETAKTVLEKFHKACRERLVKIEEEIVKLEAHQKALEEYLD